MLKLGIAPVAGDFEEWAGWPSWMGRLLWSRGIRTEDEARHFLSPSLAEIRPPLALHDMARAAEILFSAREKGKSVAIYGDYDVDGVCASAILWEALGQMGIQRQVYIPDRHEEGYGLNTPAVEKLARDCQVLVTVDCGITSIPEVAAAKAAGMEVIVTDHHRHLEELPPADAVVSPLLGDYPFPSLCGAGVAWKLALALLDRAALPLMELAALATVADMVPLTGENRALVALGLDALSQTSRPGIKALMRVAGVQGKITSEQVAFQIAPRMNACGRMESARTALEMLITRDEGRAQALALRLERLNQERRDQEALVLEEAQAQVEGMDLTRTRAIVVSGEGWNSGVVGLAAGRIAEKYAYPTVALAREGDMCVGSARSAGGVDIYAALSECAGLFERFGGHRQAAGLTIRTERVPEFARLLSRAVEKQTGGMPPLPEILCDGEMNLSQVTEETVRLLEKLEPFGIGNPAPRFLCSDVQALSLRAVGAQGKHLKCAFRQGDDLRDGIFFGGGAWAGCPAGSFRMAMTPVLNEFRGKITAECRLYALQLQPETLPEDGEKEALSLLADEREPGAAEALSPQELEDLMQGTQGTLLVCRCLQTALALRARFPQADFCLEKADDPRAFHTILLYGTARDACASYRYVVLCDGDTGESGAYSAACPQAKILALPMSRALKALLADMLVDIPGLRECYRKLRQALPRDLFLWAAESGLTRARGLFALRVLSEIGLAELSLRPFHVSLPPAVKHSPEESALFRLCRQAKEETDGLHGL